MERNIVLVGKTGHGKSATIESLKHFDQNIIDRNSSQSIKHGTADAIGSAVCLSGNLYGIFDTPSLFDSDWYTENATFTKKPYKIVDPEEPHRKLLDKVHSILASLEGRKSAVLFVIKGTARFTRESKESISVMKRYFGDSFIDRIIFVLTHVDKSRSRDFTQVNDVIRAHLVTIGYCGKINDRFICFDNESNPRDQVDNLLTKIETIFSSVGTYSTTDFHNAQTVLKEEKEYLQKQKENHFQKQITDETNKLNVEYSPKLNLEGQLCEEQAEFHKKADKIDEEIHDDKNTKPKPVFVQVQDTLNFKTTDLNAKSNNGDQATIQPKIVRRGTVTELIRSFKIDDPPTKQNSILCPAISDSNTPSREDYTDLLNELNELNFADPELMQLKEQERFQLEANRDILQSLMLEVQQQDDEKQFVRPREGILQRVRNFLQQFSLLLYKPVEPVEPVEHC